jgi:hypothetical protein
MSAKCQDETFATRLNGLAAFTAVAISGAAADRKHDFGYENGFNDDPSQTHQ